MFKFLLSSDAKARIRQTDIIIDQLYNESNTLLGKRLIKLAEQAWAEVEDILGAHNHKRIQSHRNSYLGALLFDVIPQAAIRLGYSDFDVANPNYVHPKLLEDDYVFRIYAGNVIKNTPISEFSIGSRSRHPGEPLALHVLTREVANGNPVAFAVDRIAKPSEERNRYDWIAERITEISVIRGMEKQDVWTPDMQNYKNNINRAIVGLSSDEDTEDHESIRLV